MCYESGGFWAVELSKTENTKTFTLEADTKITNICLNDDVAERGEDSRSSVKLTSNGHTGTICTLTPGTTEQATTDILLPKGARVMFQLVGFNSVFVAGYHLQFICGHLGSTKPAQRSVDAASLQQVPGSTIPQKRTTESFSDSDSRPRAACTMNTALPVGDIGSMRAPLPSSVDLTSDKGSTSVSGESTEAAAHTLAVSNTEPSFQIHTKSGLSVLGAHSDQPPEITETGAANDTSHGAPSHEPMRFTFKVPFAPQSLTSFTLPSFPWSTKSAAAHTSPSPVPPISTTLSASTTVTNPQPHSPSRETSIDPANVFTSPTPQIITTNLPSSGANSRPQDSTAPVETQTINVHLQDLSCDATKDETGIASCSDTPPTVDPHLGFAWMDIKVGTGMPVSEDTWLSFRTVFRIPGGPVFKCYSFDRISCYLRDCHRLAPGLVEGLSGMRGGGVRKVSFRSDAILGSWKRREMRELLSETKTLSLEIRLFKVESSANRVDL